MNILLRIKCCYILMLLSPVIHSQSITPNNITFLFPLNTGNVWFYDVYRNPLPGSHIHYNAVVKIENDTVMSNGKTYYQIPPMYSGPSALVEIQYLRKDNLKVYQFSGEDSSEFLRFDFSANLYDTLAVFATTPFAGIVLADTLTYKFKDSLNLRAYHFNGYVPVSQITSSLVADSIGIVRQFDTYGAIWTLIGAKINGKEYGTLLSVSSKKNILPERFYLFQNYPNPFNPTTTISFSLLKTDYAKLIVYDYLGREVSTIYEGICLSGYHEVLFDAYKLSSGQYFYKLVAGQNVSVKKMLYLK